MALLDPPTASSAPLLPPPETELSKSMPEAGRAKLNFGTAKGLKVRLG